MDYKTAAKLSWDELLLNTVSTTPPPLTVHFPVQPIHSPDLVHVDCALNACRRRVYPKLSVRDVTTWQAANRGEVFALMFALDDPPFAPDFRLSQLRVREDALPHVTGEFFAWDLLYRFEYFCAPLSQGRSILWVRGTVTNESPKPLDAHVRAKIAFHPEDKIFDYHYIPFYWDAAKWDGGETPKVQGDQLVRGGRVIGKVVANDFTAIFEPHADYSDVKYNKRFSFGEPFYVNPPFRFRELRDVIHFHASLEGGQSKTFMLGLLIDDQRADEDRGAMADANFESDRKRSLAHFRRAADAGETELIFPAESLDRIFTSLQIQNQQLLIEFPGESGLMPTQGGSSERHFVWVWEVMPILCGMLASGHFAPARRAIEFVFGLQDGGYPPEGRFASLEGAIGTTGPRWICSTGSALMLAARYATLAHNDGSFLETYLSKMLRAGDWILREIRATRKLSADGSRPLTYGLMPHGCATDGDIGYVFAITDAWSYYGLEKLTQLLDKLKHPRFAEFDREARQYREDIATTARAVQRPDGFIPRLIPGDGQDVHYLKLDNVCSSAMLAYTGVLDPASAEFRAFTEHFETKQADGLFAGAMDRDVTYVVVGEWHWQRVYLQLGQWKKAFAAMRAAIIPSMTKNTYLVQERVSKTNPAYTPWQPNGSGNGRIIEMILNAIYFDAAGTNSEVALLAGVPWQWLRRNGLTALRRLYTPGGKVTVEAQLLDRDRCRLTLSVEGGALPRRIRLPDHFSASAATPGVRAIGDGLFEIASAAPPARVEFTLTPATQTRPEDRP